VQWDAIVRQDLPRLPLDSTQISDFIARSVPIAASVSDQIAFFDAYIDSLQHVESTRGKPWQHWQEADTRAVAYGVADQLLPILLFIESADNSLDCFRRVFSANQRGVECRHSTASPSSAAVTTR
jgi:hypothetical protein